MILLRARFRLVRANRDLSPLEVHIPPLQRQDFPWPAGGVEHCGDDAAKVRVGGL